MCKWTRNVCINLVIIKKLFMLWCTANQISRIEFYVATKCVHIMNYCCFCLLWLLQYWWLLYWIGLSFLFLPQGAGFWIQFVTSFRSFISNSGLDRTDGCECCEEAFIDMLKILTTVNRWENHEDIVHWAQIWGFYGDEDFYCGFVAYDAL